MLSVRDATQSDVALICDFVFQLAVYERLENEVTLSKSNFDKYLFSNIESPRPEVFIVTRPTLIGFALFVHILPSTIYLEDLFISESARGSGGGLALLRLLARTTIQRKATSLEWMCLNWNESSIKFYQALGANIIKDRRILRISGHSLKMRILSNDLNVINISNGIIKSMTSNASISYTLGFTTFLATPVILVVGLEYSEISDLGPLIDFLIADANTREYTRVDIRVVDEDVAGFLINEFNAVEMIGWLPFKLEGQSLEKLAQL